jgi:AcrR family transcriptional regulator
MGEHMKESLEVAEGTRERILEAALVVLRDVGHGQFSVQKVAREAGVYQGNITYYWPRRRDLVLALAVRVVDDYRRTLLARCTPVEEASDSRAEVLVQRLIDDAVTEERVRVLPELWSLANADPEIARLVTTTYDAITADLIVALGVPDGHPASDAVRRALLVAGMAVQGLTALHGHRSAGDPMLEAAREALAEVHVPLLMEAVASARA